MEGTDSTDVQMKDEPTTIDIHQSPPEKLEIADDAVKTEPFTIPQSLPQDPSQPKGLAITLGQDPPAAANTVTAPIKPDPEANIVSNTNPSSSNDQTSQPPLSATFPDAQFESMFNELPISPPRPTMTSVSASTSPPTMTQQLQQAAVASGSGKRHRQSPRRLCVPEHYDA